MFQRAAETMPADERAALQQELLDTLVTRLKASDNPYWQHKLDGVEGSSLESLPFTVKAELRDAYPFGTLRFELLCAPRETADDSHRAGRSSATSPTEGVWVS